MPPG
jgi:hypothetical protein